MFSIEERSRVFHLTLVFMRFQLNDKVFVYQGPLLYEARIIKRYEPSTQKTEEVKLVQPSNKRLPKTMADQEVYLVHYQGWNVKWDEWVGLERMMEVNNDSITLKQGLEESAAPKKKPKAEAKAEAKGEAKNEAKAGAGATGTVTNGATPTATARPAKRSRMDADWTYTHYKGFTSDEIKVLVPDEIKILLVDDWENVTKDHKLVELPGQCTVADILSQFSAYVSVKFDDNDKLLDTYLEIIESLKQYFNKALGTYVLYRFERVQFTDMLKLHQERDVELCELYSGIFLVRLMAIFPNIMTSGELTIGTIRKMKDVLFTFWQWFNVRREDFLIDAYENQTPSVALLHT